MKKILFVAALLLIPFSVFTAEGKEHFTKHYDKSHFKVSEQGHFSVEIVLNNNELTVGGNQLDIIIHDSADRDVAGAGISVTPWMPEMGHGVSEKAVVAEKGGGLYRAENVVLNMAGLWELRIDIRQGNTADRVVFAFPGVKSAGAHGHEEGTTADASSDTATEKKSRKGLFSVSYESDTQPVPVNRIHTWALRVIDRDGHPVEEAEIEVNGDMPAHGHGLPTEPEVSDGPEAGLYEVDGIKFSMPGRWVMTFRISAGEMVDTVTFHLDVQ